MSKLRRTTAKDKAMIVRLLPEEHEMLRQYCDTTGRSKTIVIRTFVQSLEEKPKQVEELLNWGDTMYE